MHLREGPHVLAMAAAYASWHRRRFDAFPPFAQLDAMWAAHAGRELAHERLRATGSLHVGDVSALKSSLDAPGLVVVALTELGSIRAAVACLKACGAATVMPVWGASADYTQVLDLCRVEVLDLREGSSGLVEQLARAQRSGLLPALLLEAPSAGRRHHDFLEHRVPCSRLIEVLARRTRSRIVCIWNHVAEDGAIESCHKEFSWGTASLTQRMLTFLDDRVRREAAQYCWENTAILFKDRDFIADLALNMPEILRWRGKRSES